LISEGAKVVLLARTKTSLDSVVDEIREAGGDAHAYTLDVCVTANVDETFKTIEVEHGPIDILLNSAGVFYPTPGGEMEEKAWRSMLEVNVGGTINTCNAVLSSMKARETGNIVNISSISGLVAGSNYSVRNLHPLAFTSILLRLAILPRLSMKISGRSLNTLRR